MSRRMGDKCNTHVRDKECIKLLAGKPEGKVTLGSQRRGWEYNIRVDIKEVGWCDVNFCDSELGPCEHRSESLGFLKDMRFLTF